MPSIHSALLASVVALVIQLPTPMYSDWEWLNEHRSEAFEALMPLNLTPTTLVAYRSYRDLYQDVREQYLRIEVERSDADRLIATVVVPANSSIQQQLLEAHMKDRQVPFETLLARVAVQRATVTSQSCRSLQRQVDALSKASVTLPPYNQLILHPTVHRIVIHLPVADVDATVSDSTSPIVRWAAKTIDAVRACAR